jgi:hypothetical protein
MWTYLTVDEWQAYLKVADLTKAATEDTDLEAD